MKSTPTAVLHAAAVIYASKPTASAADMDRAVDEAVRLTDRVLKVCDDIVTVNGEWLPDSTDIYADEIARRINALSYDGLTRLARELENGVTAEDMRDVLKGALL